MDGINQEAWLGLHDAQSRGLVDRIDKIETVDSRDRAANIQALIDRSYDLVVTVGPSIAEETATAAAWNPQIAFIGVQQPQTSPQPNLTGLIFHEERSGFLAGALAAMLTQTRHVAAICEAEFVDSIRRYCEGFRAGVAYVDPSVQTSVIYRDGSNELLFHDSRWATDKTQVQLDAGADVVFAAGADTADAALEVAASHGAAVIGTETDLYYRLQAIRQQLAGSAISQVRAGLLELINLARSGGLPAGNYFGEVGLSPYHDFEGRVSSTAREAIAAIREGIESGTIPVQVPFERP